MNQPLNLRPELPAGFDLNQVEWTPLVGGPEFDYPIDYALSVVSADVVAGRIDFLVKWKPDAYCHYHRHLGTTLAAVLEGEQHLVEDRKFETVHKVRQAGFRGPVADGDAHMEYAGPNGLLMLFSIYAADGRLFELLDRQGNVLTVATIEDLAEKRYQAGA